ncbi:MAG: SoxR reducing system RseC family protein [Paludibacteraceae bacterium]|nr:SoxR reducing system RseC family protein [Paludibacteraceae bacterium]
MAEYVHHEGVVLTVKDGKARVEIVQTSACQACKAKHMCLSSESKSKLIDAEVSGTLNPGDRVEVSVREQLAWRAVWIAYVLPFLVMIGVIAALSVWTDWNDAVVGGVSIAAIALYYLLLGLFKNRLQKQFSFTARKI